MAKGLLFLVLILGFGHNSECARILGIFPVAGKSINILYNRLMRGLADAGHDVTVISAYKNKLPIQNGSFTDVVLTGFAEDYDLVNDILKAALQNRYINNKVLALLETTNSTFTIDLLLVFNGLMEETNFYQTPENYPFWKVSEYFNICLGIYQQTFKHPDVLKFLKEDHRFDLVITEYLWSPSLLGFSKIYNCPSVVFASMGGIDVWVNEMVGNPMPVSYVPHFLKLGDHSKRMGFYDRLHNSLYYLYDVYHNYFISFPSHTKLLKSVFPNATNIADVYYNVSLVLLGSHSSLRQAAPLTPNMVDIGGFHIDPPKKLPKDLKDFVDSAKEGAIFFSMGSHLKSKDFSQEKKDIFLNVFRKLKLKIIWKFEDEVLPGKPDNVIIKKWLPQVDLLGHPNIKLFITHGGYGSTLEAVYHGVPALCIPVFADQYNNANAAVQKGFALKLSYRDENFSEETLYTMIKELLDNPEYTKQAKYVSKLFHDRPMKPLDAAIYWIEYVIRHKGADHLKLAGAKLPWYEYYMVDVLLFILSILASLVYILIKLFKAIYSRIAKKEKLKKN